MSPIVITAKVAYHEPEALSSSSLCFKRNMIDRDFPLHMHDYYEIELVVEGEATQWLNGTEIAISAGSMFMLSPEDVHRFKTDMPLRLLSIKVLDNMLPAELQELLLLSRGGVFVQLPPKAFAAMRRNFLDINDELARGGPYSKSRCYAHLTLLITSLLTKAERASPPKINKPIMGYLKVALDYISENYQTQISLADVAKACNVSPCYLSTFFARHVGCNFSKYLMDFRLRKVQTLLIETDMSILDIAFAAGFGSISNFLRAYHQHFNMTPSAYRATGGNPPKDGGPAPFPSGRA
jgi:AraC-like DNA-binding protein/mannose-6-phosphate isomerase-like protein (cupin superfamily)